MEQMKPNLKLYNTVIGQIESAYQKRDAAAAAFEQATQEFRKAFGGKTFLQEATRVKYVLHDLWHRFQFYSEAANGKAKDALRDLSDRTDALLKRLESE